jgi:hypothetical protein
MRHHPACHQNVEHVGMRLSAIIEQDHGYGFRAPLRW